MTQKRLYVPGLAEMNDEIERNREKLREEARKLLAVRPAKQFSVRKPEQEALFNPKPQRRLF